MKIAEILTEKKGELAIMRDNKIPLTDDERKLVMDRKACWHHGPDGAESPAVWKAKCPKTDKIWYITDTHRAAAKAPTCKGAIAKYHNFIKGTA